MGICITPMISGKYVDRIQLKCDGKSLADFYLGYKVNEEETGEIDKVIKYDFVNRKPLIDKEIHGIKSAMKVFDKYISADENEPGDNLDNSELEGVVIAIRKWLREIDGPYYGCAGDDISENKDGAIHDCDDILMVIKLANKSKETVTVSLG